MHAKMFLKAGFVKVLNSNKILKYYQLDDSYLIYHQSSDLMQAVLSLPNSYRNVIYLFYYEGYKAVDIAHILQKKENTIHTWLKRAKKQLKDRLGGDYFE
ncbi:MAG: sigma factor-like helix-turn-helix DNA-binding protein [Thomasclavelia ramosa]